MRSSTHFLFCIVIVSASLPLAACNKKDEAADSQGGSANAASAAVDRASGKKRERKDRGDASVLLGDQKLDDGNARFRLKEGTLSVSLSWNSREGEEQVRRTVDLKVKDYKGPGTYKISSMGSRFVSVGLNVSTAKKATDDGGDEAIKAEAMKAISGAQHMILQGADVVINAASDEEVSGQFSWTAPAGLNKPSLSEGRFRATARKPRK